MACWDFSWDLSPLLGVLDRVGCAGQYAGEEAFVLYSWNTQGRRRWKGAGFQFNLTYPVSHLPECPGGSESPCNGHGTCLDGIQQNGTCVCKVSARFTPRVMCFVRGSCLCGVCAGAPGKGCPSVWEATCSSFHSSINVCGFPAALVWVCNSIKTLLMMMWSWEESQGWNKERIALI